MFFRKKIPRTILLLSITALLPALCGCAREPAAETISFFAMDTAATATLPAGCDCTPARETLLALSDALDCYRTESPVSAINRTGSGSCITAAEIVTQTQALSARFGNAVQLSCGAVTQLWGISTDHPTVPDEAALRDALLTIGDAEITVQDDTITLPDGAMLDLGAVAKGYALDLVAEQWQQSKPAYGVCSMHSAVLLYGEKPDGKPFSVQIQNPADNTDTLGTVSTDACFLATAGGYERNFTADDGSTYCHILDLTTGKPVNSDLTTVTVFADNGLKADYLSTLIFLEGTVGLEKHLAADDYKLVAADTAGKLYVSTGLAFTEAAE